MDLFATSWETVEAWLVALAEVACFTDIESDYRVVGLLGSGSSSRVYAAVQLATGQKVAIKRMAKCQWKGIPEKIVKEVGILRKMKGKGG